MVDCSITNSGCNGGLMDRAFTYIHNHGITTESKYPYKGTKGKCDYKDAEKVFTVKSFTDVSGVANLAAALVK